METILEMTIIDWIIFWLTIIAMGIIMRGMVKTKNDNSQVALTWLLYFLLDVITMLITIKALIKSGGWQVLFGSAIVSFLMFIVLLRKKKIIWTQLEIGVIMLIITCVVVWIIRGPYKAIIWGIISEFIVGLYLLIRTIKFPVVQYNLWGYILFLLACGLSMYNAPDWSIREIGYPASEIIITSLTIIPLLIKLFKEKKETRK